MDNRPDASTGSEIRLPIVIVDDDAPEMQAYLRILKRALPGSEIELISSLQEAESMLMARREPFLLVMDQNFEKSKVDGTRKGSDLVSMLRQQHVWGAFLPILLLSGNVDDQDNTRLNQELGWRSPTVYLAKRIASSTSLDLEAVPSLELDYADLPAYLPSGLKYLLALLVHLDRNFTEQMSIIASQQASLAVGDDASEYDMRDWDDWDSGSTQDGGSDSKEATESS